MSEGEGHKLHGVPRGTSHGHRLVVVLLVIFQPAIAVKAEEEVFMVLWLMLLLLLVVVVVVIHDESDLKVTRWMKDVCEDEERKEEERR